MVLSSPTFLLAATTRVHQSGEETEGLQANVSPSRRYQLLDVCGLHVSLDQSWQCYIGDYGCSGFFVTGMYSLHKTSDWAVCSICPAREQD